MTGQLASSWQLDLFKHQPDGSYRLVTQTLAMTAFPLARIRDALERTFTDVEAVDGAGQPAGADEVINYVATVEWGNCVRALTAGAVSDWVVEAIGPDTLEQSLAAASLYGQIVLLITRDGKPSRVEIAGTACAAASPRSGVCL
jgi:NADPH:quinone reductase-like Zn-dependent oxidoreductase